MFEAMIAISILSESPPQDIVVLLMMGTKVVPEMLVVYNKLK
jgi:hypothetical protein